MTPTSLFKCLADETRLRCVVLLHKEGKLCVCELTHALDLLQPKISRHLAQLRQGNLLLDSREGHWVYYQINPELPAWVFEILDVAAKQSTTNAKQQKDSVRLKAMGGRPDLTKHCG
jgi:ArsR family transcriptional regulator